MHVKVIKQAIRDSDWRDGLQIVIDGQIVFDVMDGEPEDANLSRDFKDCYKIPELMRKAFEAGLNGDAAGNGERFTVEEVTESL